MEERQGFIPASQGFLYAETDENHKLIIKNQQEAYSEGLPLVEFEQAFNGNLYEKGYCPNLTNEEIDKMRIDYRHVHIDDKTLARMRKMANGTWTDEDEKEYLELDAEINAYINENFPNPDIDESGE